MKPFQEDILWPKPYQNIVRCFQTVWVTPFQDEVNELFSLTASLMTVNYINQQVEGEGELVVYSFPSHFMYHSPITCYKSKTLVDGTFLLPTHAYPVRDGSEHQAF